MANLTETKQIPNISAMKKSNIAGPTQNDPMKFFRNQYYAPGELARLRQIVRDSGRTMILPYDQFIEHDNRHIDPNPDAANPDYICNLALQGGYNAVAVHYGLAKRYWSKLAGAVPLLLKLNSSTALLQLFLQAIPLSTISAIQH